MKPRGRDGSIMLGTASLVASSHGWMLGSGWPLDPMDLAAASGVPQGSVWGWSCLTYLLMVWT